MVVLMLLLIAVAASFNEAAARIEKLVRSHQRLLASRIDVLQEPPSELLDLQALAAEELSRVSDLSTLLQAEPGTLNVVGDERLRRRALRNLLENARRYGVGQLDVCLTGQNDQAAVWVCDRGDGVPADQRERIFEPFYRLPGHAERAGGVGLSLVKQIATHHHGTVR